MDGPAQVGAFAVGAARTEAVVKHVDVAGIWRILLLGVVIWTGRGWRTDDELRQVRVVNDHAMD